MLDPTVAQQPAPASTSCTAIFFNSRNRGEDHTTERRPRGKNRIEPTKKPTVKKPQKIKPVKDDSVEVFHRAPQPKTEESGAALFRGKSRSPSPAINSFDISRLRFKLKDRKFIRKEGNNLEPKVQLID
ncbi:unnamed protein product [Linum trigynum]|uniref:Uncharacterized protein n=1 Tax=Linum trigynum TaxID=586398 RepID=A0AAV2ERE2_9ROSI